MTMPFAQQLPLPGPINGYPVQTATFGVPLGPLQLNQPVPPVAWVAHDFIARGTVNLIAGRCGAKKSLVALDLLVSVATGRPLFGTRGVSPGRAIYLDYENGSRRMRTRAQKLMLGQGVPPTAPIEVYCFPGLRLNDDGFALALAGLVAMPPVPHLVVIDTLLAALPGVDENDSGIRQYIDRLRPLADQLNVAFVLIHHAGKGQKQNGTDIVRGSSAIADAVDVVIEAQGTDGGVTLRWKKNRDGEAGGPIDLDFVVSPAGYALEERQAAQVAAAIQHVLDTTVLQAVQQAPGSNQEALAKATGHRKADVTQSLQRLVQAGAVAHPGPRKGYHPSNPGVTP